MSDLPLPAVIADLPREIAFILAKVPAGVGYVDSNQRYRYVNERFGAAAARRAPAFSWDESIRKLTAALARHGYLPSEFAEQKSAA